MTGQLGSLVARLRRSVTRALLDPGRGLLFRLLRRYQPVLVLGGRRGGLALVLRYDDVSEVYSRDEVFSVRHYGDRMAETTGAFILGMDDGLQYRREAKILRAAVHADDPQRVGAQAEAEAERLVRRTLAERGRIDVVADLALLVHPAFVASYYGFGPLDGAPLDPRTVVRWFRTTAFYVFNFWPGAWLQAPAIDAAREVVAHLEKTVAARNARRAAGATTDPPPDDVLERLLDLRRDPESALTDAELVRTLAGIVSGSVEPGVSSFGYLLDDLLDRPRTLAALHDAATRNDRETVRAILLEAARFGCYPPALARQCTRPHTFGAGTRWERRISPGTTVVAMQASAMFDESMVEQPYAFRPGRDPAFYRNFGNGRHRCLGEAIGIELWVAMAMPLLRLRNLRRAPGANGFARNGKLLDIPEGLFIQHLEVTGELAG